eukprot:21770_1
MNKHLWMIALLVTQTLLTFLFASNDADYSLSSKNKTNTNAVECNTCRQTILGGKRFRCSKCKTTYYCDKVCQENDWKNHKKYCKVPSKEKKQPKSNKSPNALKLASAYVRGNYVIDERFCFPDHICSTIADYVAETGLDIVFENKLKSPMSGKDLAFVNQHLVLDTFRINVLRKYPSFRNEVIYDMSNEQLSKLIVNISQETSYPVMRFTNLTPELDIQSIRRLAEDQASNSLYWQVDLTSTNEDIRKSVGSFIRNILGNPIGDVYAIRQGCDVLVNYQDKDSVSVRCKLWYDKLYNLESRVYMRLDNCRIVYV